MRPPRAPARAPAPPPPPQRPPAESPDSGRSATPAAAIAAAAARVKRAQESCRTAARHLAQAQNGGGTYAIRTCATSRDVDEIAALARLALAEHDRVDVVVLIAP